MSPFVFGEDSEKFRGRDEDDGAFNDIAVGTTKGIVFHGEIGFNDFVLKSCILKEA